MEPPPNKSDRRVTMLDLARATGLNVSSVSRALRGHTRLSEGTRRKVQEAAERLGYQPDPALSALAAYRSRIRPTQDFGQLAFIVDDTRPEESLPIALKLHVQGARQRAAKLGYSMDLFHISRTTSEQKHLSKVLHARGIRGVILGPLKTLPASFDFPRFSVVAIGENMARLGLHSVVYDHDETISVTYRKLREHGYQKIGFCNIADSELRNRHLFLGSYLKCLHLDGRSSADHPELLYDDRNWSPIPWLEANRFDAVITMLPMEFIRLLEGSRFKVPDNLGLASFCLPQSVCEPLYSSFVSDTHRQGSVAVDLIHALIQNQQLGIPPLDHQYSITVRGNWFEGQTVRQVGEKKAVLPIFQDELVETPAEQTARPARK